MIGQPWSLRGTLDLLRDPATALPAAAILRQLDEMRRWLGPKSNVQITDGEVTLRPEGELIEILRCPEEVRTSLGQQSLDACLFRLPYQGEMVPMCKMNADGVRERFYAEIIDGGAAPL